MFAGPTRALVGGAYGGGGGGTGVSFVSRGHLRSLKFIILSVGLLVVQSMYTIEPWLHVHRFHPTLELGAYRIEVIVRK